MARFLFKTLFAIFTLVMIGIVGSYIFKEDIIRESCMNEFQTSFPNSDIGAFCGCAAQGVVAEGVDLDDLETKEGRAKLLQGIGGCMDKFLNEPLVQKCRERIGNEKELSKMGFQFDCHCAAKLAPQIYVEKGEFEDHHLSATLACLKHNGKYIQSRTQFFMIACTDGFVHISGRPLNAFEQLNVDAYCSCVARTSEEKDILKHLSREQTHDRRKMEAIRNQCKAQHLYAIQITR